MPLILYLITFTFSKYMLILKLTPATISSIKLAQGQQQTGEVMERLEKKKPLWGTV